MESTLQLDRVLVTLASAAITFSLYDQARKIWRTKSVQDFTWTILVALLFNELAWFKYGLGLREWPIILVSALNLPAVLAAGLGYLRYRKGAL